MALKDWEKLKNNYPFVKGYWKSKNGDFLTVKFQSAIGKGEYFNPEEYVVLLNFENELKSFKSQSQAMCFAKTYMRSHS